MIVWRAKTATSRFHVCRACSSGWQDWKVRLVYSTCFANGSWRLGRRDSPISVVTAASHI